MDKYRIKTFHVLSRSWMAGILFLLLCCAGQPLAAQEAMVYTPDNLPKVHLQNKYRYTCDPEHILSPAATDSIDRMLYRLEQQTGIETVVAVVPSIGDADSFDFCHELLNSWGVGKKGKDNGLVILLVTGQRRIQFYTGYGLEGPLPDAICKRIQTQEMIPYLKDGRWSEGMVAGVRAACARLDGSMENEGDSGDSLLSGGTIAVLLFLFFLAVWVAVAVASNKNRSIRCPKCRKRVLKRASSQTVSFHNGVKTEDVIYICQNCGHVVTRREHHNHNNRSNGGGWGGPVIFGGFGGFGGRGGGGGFSGGSFGGGSGGGGGAGSDF